MTFLNEKTIPVLMLVLEVAAATVYAIQKDVRHAVYWFGAAVVTAAVTF